MSNMTVDINDISVPGDTSRTPLDQFLVVHLVNMLSTESNSLGLRLVLQSLGIVLPICLHHLQLCRTIPNVISSIVQLVTLSSGDAGSFWGVKYELLELLDGFNYSLLSFYDDASTNVVRTVLDRVIWQYIEDDNTRVRERACRTLMTLLPHYISDGKDGVDVRSRLVKQFVSDDIHRFTDTTVVRDHELENVASVISRCLSKLSLVSADKSRLSGTLLVLNQIAKRYGRYDESSAYLVNHEKGLHSSDSPSNNVLSIRSVEVIEKLLDVIKFDELSTDLNVHTLLVQTMGLFVLELDIEDAYNRQQSEGLVSNVQELTAIILGYVMMMLMTISELDKSQENTTSGTNTAPTTTGNNSPTTGVAIIVTATTNPLDGTIQYHQHRPFANMMNKFIYDKLNTNMQRSMRSSDTVLANRGASESVDAISLLRAELLKLLYFLILYGDQHTILPNTVDVIRDLQKHAVKDRIHSILCTQELFVSLFGKKNRYYSIANRMTSSNDNDHHKAMAVVNEWTTGMFDKLFIDSKPQGKGIGLSEVISTGGRVRTSKRIRTASLLRNNKKRSAALQTDKIAYVLILFFS
jgi:hypothetical protein